MMCIGRSRNLLFFALLGSLSGPAGASRAFSSSGGFRLLRRSAAFSSGELARETPKDLGEEVETKPRGRDDPGFPVRSAAALFAEAWELSPSSAKIVPQQLSLGTLSSSLSSGFSGTVTVTVSSSSSALSLALEKAQHRARHTLEGPFSNGGFQQVGAMDRTSWSLLAILALSVFLLITFSVLITSGDLGQPAFGVKSCAAFCFCTPFTCCAPIDASATSFVMVLGIAAFAVGLCLLFMFQFTVLLSLALLIPVCGLLFAMFTLGAESHV